MNEKAKNELDFGKVFYAIVACKNILLTYWKRIIAIGFICGILGITYAWLQPKTYIAELSFATDDKSPANSFSNLAGQLGLDLFGKADGGAFKGDNLAEVMTSRFVIEETLLTPVKINGKDELLINYYLQFTKFYEGGEKAQAIQYVIGQPRDSFKRSQDSLLHQVSEGLKKGNISVVKFDKKLSIFKLTVTSEDELFAQLMCETLAKAVYTMYVDLKTRQTRKNIQILENRLDSVKNILEEEMYQSASTQDQNQNAALARVRVPYLKRQVNVQFLTTMFMELTKNIELSKMNLVKEEPLIQTLDRPIPPLKFEKYSRLVFGVVFTILGGVLVSLFVIGRALYTSFINKENFIERYTTERNG